ncbi:hypothetical protein CLAFUW4_13671 [Fulvia fulva]|uniref:EamA domain-containing protein n=1 Tax=Passalora fulva TaxID=5499 RepID=A0A9Q8PKW1_PASFU|nr:uncharacterized protein CLAFUR5_13520 [Fulvia fulva]KAK4610216.1 hypothetical protein CLAFUR4_13674 [Fulvia fulva]KAK4610990.1 hypothetical protein CLAFUR0_13678 [Fulvia fulva]UJO24259.1 hypothetical protein CLAFUR5_13520 [Fulvia fulva]WPV21989.1 hypothetical protein CLAFUW4_13671 [Fulvia fulva]WPV36789.1 hypothetical protein CLAFUW7_13679 [Fulvia fulva]
MSRPMPDTARRKPNQDDHDEPLLENGRHSLESDVELAELDERGGYDLEGERTPASHYRDRDHLPPKRVAAWKIALALTVCVAGLVINTEATAYFEDEIGWKKPFAAMYLMHSSLALPWVCHLGWQRWQNRRTPYMQWVRDYNNQLRGLIASVPAFASSGPSLLKYMKLAGQIGGPLDYMCTTMAIVTIALTCSGSSWFFALALTTPGDLTAIYNCATFFAAAFSIPLLGERLGWMGMLAIVISIGGTFTIAYGDTAGEHSGGDEAIGASRLLGNVVACFGAVAFGLYEVLFKKWACPSGPESQHSSLPLPLSASALTGAYTFGILWVVFLPLHFLGWETFEIPNAWDWLWIAIAVLAGAIAMTLLVILVIWTNPVFGSMANVLSVFFVALADWMLWGIVPSMATYIGGALIFIGFGLLSYETLSESAHKK